MKLKTLKKEREIVRKLREIPEEKRTLKTLKDIEEKGIAEGDVENFKIKLKEEAIKWVKERGVRCGICTGWEDFMEFFNITEDELKDTKKGCGKKFVFYNPKGEDYNPTYPTIKVKCGSWYDVAKTIRCLCPKCSETKKGCGKFLRMSFDCGDVLDNKLLLCPKCSGAEDE